MPGPSNDNFELDLAGYKDSRAARVPKGDYTVMVDEITKSFAKDSGNLMYTMWLEIADGPWKGSRILDRLVMTDNSKWRAVAFAQAAGILPQSGPIAGRPPVKMPFSAVKGRRLVISVDDGDEWNGRVKSEVKDYQRFVGKATEDEVAESTEVEETEETPPPAKKAPAKKAGAKLAPESEPEEEAGAVAATEEVAPEEAEEEAPTPPVKKAAPAKKAAPPKSVEVDVDDL